jgi:hypothetical protein
LNLLDNFNEALTAASLNLNTLISDFWIARRKLWDKAAMTIRKATMILAILASLGHATGAQAQQHCHHDGTDVTCDDGHRGIWSGDSITWPDGTRSRVSPHPSVIIGNKSSVTVGPGVFVGQGKGMVPLDDPSKTRCVTLDGTAYCN